MKYEKEVVEWAVGKGIIEEFSSNVSLYNRQVTQLGKMLEEVAEFEEAVVMGDHPAQVDELGDVLVTCIIQANLMGIGVEDALSQAYDKISKRKGKTVDGVFIKES